MPTIDLKKLKTRLRSAIRKEWMWSDLRRLALANARVSRGIYRCAGCKQLFGPKQMDVDHKVQCTPKGVEAETNPKEFWGGLIANMHYCGLEGLDVLCKDKCHKAKTKAERAVKKKVKKKKKRDRR